MQKTNQKRAGLGISIIMLYSALLTLLLATSCNKDFPKTLKTGYPIDTANIFNKNKKVLYIVLDGVRGNILNSVAAPNIKQIIKQSVYTYDGLADYQTGALTDATAWSNMLLGVNSDKHHVISTDFANNQIDTYPSIFTRLKSEMGNLRTSSIVASKVINEKLAFDATFKADFENDDIKVKDGVLEELKNPATGLIFAQFHSAEIAGENFGYTDGSIEYKNAISNLDNYIGLLLTALKQRSTYSQEDWLVVIASNKGGDIPNTVGPVFGAFSDPVRNNFVIYHNPRFLTQYVPKPDANSFPYTGIGPRFVTTLSSTAIPGLAQMPLTNRSIGNVGATGNYTFIFKVRNNNQYTGLYPVFLGKRTVAAGGDAGGWMFQMSGDNYQLYWGSSAVNGTLIRDAKWHTIGFKIYTEGAVRNVATFTDGVRNSTLAITGKNLDNTNPLRIGAIQATNNNQTIDMLFKDVAMFNVAIPDAELADVMRKEISSSTPYFTNLIGWWPGDEGSGNKIFDKTGNGNDFELTGSVSWSNFEDTAPNISPTIKDVTFRSVINSVDVPFQIYNWMGVSVPMSWHIDGKIWKTTYTDVRN